jgi:lipoprotein LprG
MPPRTAAPAAAVLLLALAGCTGDPDDGAAPAADSLLAAAADEMAAVQTVRLRLEADANVAELPVRQVEAQVTGGGDAAGTAQLDQFGQRLEVAFVVVGDEFHYRLVGDWQQSTRADAADLYDPSAILDPERGVANLLRTATSAEVDGDEEIEGVATYRVTAGFDPAAVAALLPGAPAGLTGTLWIGVDRPLLHQARFDLPDGGGPVTVRLHDHDAPAQISAP